MKKLKQLAIGVEYALAVLVTALIYGVLQFLPARKGGGSR
jgi:hypothetical protein